MEEGFSELRFSDRDDYNRKPIADNIITLLQAEIEISPMVIDGQWGSGKSEFCHKLKNLIKDEHQELTPVYLNAYQYDYGDDAFMMLLSAITKLIDDGSKDDKKNKINKQIKQDIVKTACAVATVVGKNIALPALNKWLGIDVEKFTKETANALGDVEKFINITQNPEMTMEKDIKAFEDFTDNLTALKTALKAYTQDKKIVIFIDELDRCNPIFALSLLEKVKHIFDVTGIQFVFITNMSSLAATIENQYGKIDAKTYLSKFFVFKIGLPNEVYTKTVVLRANMQHFHIIVGKSSININVIDNKEIYNLLDFLFRKDRRTLRDVERYFKNFEIFQTLPSNYSIQQNTNIGTKLLTMLTLYLISFEPEMQHRYLDGTVNKQDVNRLFGYDADRFPKFQPNMQLDIDRDTASITHLLFIVVLHEANDLQPINNQGWKNLLQGCFKHDFWEIEKADNPIYNTIKTMQFVKQ